MRHNGSIQVIVTYSEKQIRREEGYTTNIFKYIYEFLKLIREVMSENKTYSNANRFFIFVGIGLFAGNALQNIWQYHDDAIAFACVMISGGAALVIYYFIAAKKLKEKPQE